MVVSALTLVAATVALATGARAAPAAPSAGRTPILGIEWRPAKIARLSWFNPISMRPLPGRKVPVGDYSGGWSFSADRSVLALGHAGLAKLRFVDTPAMRLRGDLELTEPTGFSGSVRTTSWPARRRLLALIESGLASEKYAAMVVVVDPLARRVVRRVRLPRSVWEAERSRDGLVLLLGTWGRFGAAQVALVDEDGVFRIATIPRIEIGAVTVKGEDHLSRFNRPGLAVDREGERAYVVGPGETVAEVDLNTARVSYHVAREVASFKPDAEQKISDGPERVARYLGGGLIAVSGFDSSSRKRDGKMYFSVQASGLHLVDTRTWQRRTLNPRASSFLSGGGLVFALGGSHDSDGQADSVGIVAYGMNGVERYRLYSDQQVWMAAWGSLGYVFVRDGAPRPVVELRSGRILHSIKLPKGRPLPTLLVERSGF